MAHKKNNIKPTYEKMARPKIDPKQLQKNIARNQELHKQQLKFDAAAALSTLTAIANYFGGAVALEEQEKNAAIILLTIAVITNLAAIYCMAQSHKKGKQALQALMHDYHTKEK